MCGKQNHLERVCQLKGNEKQGAIWCIEDGEASMDALIVHVVFNPITDTNRLGNNNGCEEVKAILIPFSPYQDPRQAKDIPTTHLTRLRIYPDSSVTICLSEPKHLQHMGLSERILVSSRKKVCTVGGFSLVCQGWLPVSQGWEKNHEAGTIHMQESTGNILQWC